MHPIVCLPALGASRDDESDTEFWFAGSLFISQESEVFDVPAQFRGFFKDVLCFGSYLVKFDQYLAIGSL